VRQGFVKAKTAQANQIRGLLGECGVVVPQGIDYIAQRVPALIEDAANELPGTFRLLVSRLLDHLKLLHQQVDEIESQIKAWHRSSDASRRLEKVPGIGPLTVTALVATVGDAWNFANGGQLATWLGVDPRQHSSGGKPTLFGMSKRGDAYLRTLVIHGARSVIYRATQKAANDNWVVQLTARRSKNVAAVALANKTARTAWALLAHDRRVREQLRSGIVRRPRIQPRRTTTDCSGNQLVMARQVRPWSVQPAPEEAPRVRVSDRGTDKQNTARLAAKVRMYGCNLSARVIKCVIRTSFQLRSSR
jgi:hypothetical protein